ncbi:SYF2-domain-containing protein [Gloeophyllum trabeum ATCC 11539]|uniref:Pre-mRNA-splicing factor SYF2 n=1 Tax=Gloeophyllum trabeum (strain ATCC 11539 / FP-39264 / Madison 617) TaxID=670483 RepID=S7PWC0_GLOTA|nr:SYF2-domain-containing protein [Gloeophyllum trabeum ATCC 11539]EPQ51818.1 SYF2-domain-containing protein [Gloeophyllum trabeum ATCC 11539]
MEVAHKVAESVSNVAGAAEEFARQMTEGQEAAAEQSKEDVEMKDESEKKLSLEERRAKLEQLRNKMRSSAIANRQSLVEESQKQKLGAKEAARLDRQRKLAETLRLKADAEERGEDIERQKNWEYTIEENDEWEKKKARKARRADFEFHDDAHAARRKYKKDLDYIKPDLAAYNRQKEVALGLAPGTLLIPSSQQQQLAAESLYRDANTLLYADNKPSEEAIDRVVEKLNRDIDKKRKFHRKRANEDEGDITYINERNRVFNKKIARFYDKYTAEIRASFERGTAL